MTDFIGTSDDDRLIGGGKADSFDISQGGADTIKAGGGGDYIGAGGAFSANDQIDGGAGDDVLVLDGDYSAGLTFGAKTLLHVERMELDSGHSYDLTLADQSAASNDDSSLSISAVGDRAKEQIHIDASAFQAGHQLEYSDTGAANSTVLGGAGDDTVTFVGSGHFDVTGGDGSDTVALYRDITKYDHFAGGEGDNDTLVMLSGQTSTLTGAMLDNVETLWVYGGDYAITMRDSTVAAGASMHLYAGDLESGQHVAFDGSAERDGTYTITGGADSDTLTGGRGDDSIAAGSGDDVITGGRGGDLLSGEDGADTFIYGALSDSGHHGQFDLITDLDDGDTIDLSALDANTAKAGDQAFHIVTAFSGHAGELVLTYNADSDLTTLAVDVNGDSKADMAVQIAGDHHDFTHFVL
jgi:Ca2+-binding RTX toxin-like protein